MNIEPNLTGDSKSLTLEIHMRNGHDVNDFFAEQGESGSVTQLSVGACLISFSSAGQQRSVFPGLAEPITVVLTFGAGVASKVVASWLYDKLKGRATESRVERKTIEFSPDGICRIIDEMIHTKG